MSVLRPLITAGCLVAAQAPLVTAVAAQGDEVVEVKVVGTQYIHPDRVLSRIRTRVGSVVREAVLNDDVRTIEEMGAFANTTKSIERVGPGQARVTFQVRELPFLSSVRIEGVGFFTRRSIRKVLRTVEGGHLNPLLVEADRRSMLRELRSKNYLNATIEARTTVDETTGLGQVLYVVDTGTKVEVARTRYKGFPEGAFKYFADQRVLNSPGRTFEPDMLDLHDVGAVENYLHELGYLEAKVTGHNVEYYDEVQAYEPRARNGPRLVPEGERNDRVVIVFYVEAGPRYRLGNVQFVGNTVASSEDMRRAFGMPTGSWFERRDIDTGKREAMGLIRNQGHAQAFMLEDPVADREALTVDLTFQVREGSKYRIGRVDIDGNIKTKDAVVRRNMRMMPGDIWTDTASDSSRRQILREGVFDNNPARPLRITPLFSGERDIPGSEGMKEVDLLVELTEAKTGSFSFNVGYATGPGVVGRITFSENNFDLWGLMTGEGWRGGAHRLNASTSVSDESTSISVSWTNPHIMDGPYLWSLRASRVDSSALDWDERRVSFGTTVGRNFLDNDLRIRLGYTYTDLYIDDVDNDATDDALNGAGDYWLNTVRLSQEYSLLNHPMFPTQGWRVEFAQEINGNMGVLSSRDEFMRYTGEFDGFLPIAESNLGGVTYIHLGQRLTLLDDIGDSEDVPFYERVFGGGAAPRHRGFDRFDLGPTAINANGFDSRTGGTTDYVATLELSMPLTGTNDGMRVVTFFDAGNVWGSNESFDFGDLRYAVGAGLRFPATFPVAFDYAFLLDPKPGESRTQFHFTLSGFVF